MNLQKYTQKSMEALQEARTLMASHGNSQITQEHLFLALMNKEEGIAADLVREYLGASHRPKDLAGLVPKDSVRACELRFGKAVAVFAICRVNTDKAL